MTPICYIEVGEVFGVRLMQRLWRSIRCSDNRLMLINSCRHLQGPENLDKSLETGNNCRNRQTSEDRDVLTSINNSALQRSGKLICLLEGVVPP